MRRTKRSSSGRRKPPKKSKKKKGPTPATWDDRYQELLLFLAKYGRKPDRKQGLTKAERSLGWWVRDQRRKMARGEADRKKRGTLTDNQYALLEGVGIHPMPPMTTVPE